MPMQTYGPGNSPSPGDSPDKRPSREPQWTTGQGIGFLVAFSGWMLAFLGLVGVIISGYVEADGSVTAVFGASLGLGVVSAIPGTVVFNKCKHPQA